jgi:hypothetical protein
MLRLAVLEKTLGFKRLNGGNILVWKYILFLQIKASVYK